MEVSCRASHFRWLSRRGAFSKEWQYFHRKGEEGRPGSVKWCGRWNRESIPADITGANEACVCLEVAGASRGGQTKKEAALQVGSAAIAAHNLCSSSSRLHLHVSSPKPLLSAQLIDLCCGPGVPLLAMKSLGAEPGL